MASCKVGVVGVGKMGEYHVGVLSEMRSTDLVGIVDSDQERAKTISERHNVPFYSDYRDIISKVDVVVIAVPTSLHYSVGKEFLEAGVHTLLEKPCTDNLEQARELFDLADKKNLTLHIGHVERFNGAVQELFKIVEDPIYLECRRMSPFTSRIKDDGVVLDVMIHDIDIILSLIPHDVVNVNVVGSSVFSGRDDLINAQIEFDNGCIANIIASRVSQNKVRTLEVTQKDSSILLDYTEQEIFVHRKSSSEHQVSGDSLRYKQESLVERMMLKSLRILSHHWNCFKIY